MQPTLYVFRLRKRGGMVITTDQSGSRLPIDMELDYKPGDWKFLEAIPTTELSSMLFDHREVEPAVASHGYFSIAGKRANQDHPFFRRHPA